MWLDGQKARGVALNPDDMALARLLIATLEKEETLALGTQKEMPSLACGPAGRRFIALFWEPLGIEILIEDGQFKWQMSVLHRGNHAVETDPAVPKFVAFAKTVVAHL